MFQIVVFSTVNFTLIIFLFRDKFTNVYTFLKTVIYQKLQTNLKYVIRPQLWAGLVGLKMKRSFLYSLA